MTKKQPQLLNHDEFHGDHGMENGRMDPLNEPMLFGKRKIEKMGNLAAIWMNLGYLDDGCSQHHH